VLAKNKTGDEQANHRNFVTTIKGLLTALADYANDHFKMGLTWKTGGSSVSSFKPGQKSTSGSDQKSNSTEARLESIAARLEKLAFKSGKSDDGKPAAVTAYEELQKEHVDKFLATVNSFPQLKQLADWTRTSFDFQGTVIAATFVCSKPSEGDFSNFLKPIIGVIQSSEKCDNKSEFFNHQKGYNEGIQALGWLMQPGPKAAITGQSEAADLYLNKILVKAKSQTGDDQTNNRAFVANLKGLLAALADYAGEYFKMGLVWKAGGTPLSSYKPAK